MNLPNGLNPWTLGIEIILVLGLLWFLFFRRQSSFSPDPRRLQKIELKLAGGLTPHEVRVRSGTPAQLLIHRFDQDPDDELFEIQELGIYELLPALHTTIIAFTPERRGRFPLILGGERHAGVIIVE